MRLFFLVNNFAHDFFSALWLSSFAILAFFRFHYGAAAPQLAAAIDELSGIFFWVQQISLLLIAATGSLRAIDIKKGYSLASPSLRRSVLVVKHLLLGILFLSGSILAFLWRH